MPRINKILILVLNTRWFNRRFFHMTGYTPCLLASIINDTVDVDILDANLENLDYNQVAQRIRKLAPDYQPQMSLVSSIEELRDGLVAMNFNDSNFRESRLIRLKMLTELQEKGLCNESLDWI